jgi:hypothetical protein
MGVEVKSGGEGVIVADRGCNDGCCCNGRNSGWGSGWGAVGGALVGGGFGAAAVSVWDKINDTKADIQKVESTVQEAKAGIYKDISDAARGVTQEISGVAKDVAGVGREILNNRFTTERGLCDLGYKTNSDIRDSRDQMGAGFNRVMDRICQMEHEQQNCCETKGLIKEVKSELALQLERCCCDLKNGQQEIKCLIENTAKDQEIARLNRVVDAQRDQNIIQSVVAALKTTSTTPAQ